MQSIVLKNFKSYENQALSNLNSRINVIIGSNGQGKSNFFKGNKHFLFIAITFLFTEKYTINRKEFNSILNVILIHIINFREEQILNKQKLLFMLF